MIWKMDGVVSIPAHIFSTIQKDSPEQTIGFILFGADGHFKKEIQKLTGSWLRGFTRLCFDFKDATKPLKPPGQILVELKTKESCDREYCQKLIQGMRASGAGTIIGIHAKAAKQPKCFFKCNPLNKAINAIRNKGPKDKDFDHYIVVEEKSG